MKGNYFYFDDWWNEIVLYDNNSYITRKNVVLGISNKDGGAHVDGMLPKGYSDISVNHTLSGCILDKQGKEHPFRNNPMYATNIGIGLELLHSIRLYQNTISSKRIRSYESLIMARMIEKNKYFIMAENQNHALFVDQNINSESHRKHYIITQTYKNKKTGTIHLHSI